jgi:hypothetical protein
MSEARFVHLLHQAIARDALQYHYYHPPINNISTVTTNTEESVVDEEQQMAIMLTLFQRLCQQLSLQQAHKYSNTTSTSNDALTSNNTMRSFDFLDFALFYQNLRKL